MRRKRILYRAHALRRLRERGITRHHVRDLLAAGAWRRRESGRWLVDGRLEGRRARLVLEERSEALVVITVMWVV